MGTLDDAPSMWREKQPKSFSCACSMDKSKKKFPKKTMIFHGFFDEKFESSIPTSKNRSDAFFELVIMKEALSAWFWRGVFFLA